MAEYIDREMAVYRLAKQATIDGQPRAIRRAMRIIQEFPAADVAPVKHGKWIWDDEGYYCSECFHHAYGCTGEEMSGIYLYCPRCGARMEVEA